MRILNGIGHNGLRQSFFGALLAGPTGYLRRVAGLDSWIVSTAARRTYFGVAIVLLITGTTCFVQLGAAKLWDRDEPRNAGCAREMLQRQDWVVPVFNGELRTHKPILLYWQTMLAYSAMGVHEFSARFSSALLGVGTCLLTWAIGRRLFSDAVGVLAGCVLGTSLMFLVAARAATPDATLIFYMTASLAAYVYAAFPAAGSAAAHDDRGFVPFPNRLQWAAIYGLMSMAVLTKGPVGFLLPTAAIGLFLLFAQQQAGESARGTAAGMTLISRWGRWIRGVAAAWEPRHFVRTTWRMHVGIAVVMLAVIALPWYVWVGIRTDGEWLRGFFLEHNLARATQAMEGHRGSVLWFYPAAILAGMFPWSLFAVPVLIDLKRQFQDRRYQLAYMLLICWVIVIVGAFSIAKTKLPSYVTPCYPALALLVAVFLDRWSRGVSGVSAAWMRVAFGCGILVGLVLVVALPLVAQQSLPGEGRLGFIGLVPLTFSVIGLFAMMRRPRTVPAWHVAGALLMMVVVFGWGVVRVSRHQQYDAILRAFPKSRDVPVAALSCLEPSWVFYSGRIIYEVEYPRPKSPVDAAVVQSAFAAFGSGHPFRPRIPVDQFLSEWPRGMVIVTSEGYEKLGEWRSHVEIVARAPRFLKKGEVLLLRRKAGPRFAESTASR